MLAFADIQAFQRQVQTSCAFVSQGLDCFDCANPDNTPQILFFADHVAGRTHALGKVWFCIVGRAGFRPGGA